ncbi:MAG: lipopolysaccharide biosynthesis protein [Steroidobacteraceae bacterium]
MPLAFGPWLTRLYVPEQFGHYTVFAAVAANIAVVACARYDFALPLVTDEGEARDLMALCLRLLLAASGLGLVVAAGAVASGALPAYWLWLPLAVLCAGAAQWLALWASRAQRFAALSASRVVQYGGAALAQAAGGLLQLGTAGLIAGPVVSSAAALVCLGRPAPAGGWRGLRTIPRPAWLAVARRHRDFPLLNMPHAFAGALQDTVVVMLLVALTGEAAAGYWGLALRYLKAPSSLVGGAISQALYPRLARSSPEEARAAVAQVMKTLTAIAVPIVLVLMAIGPDLFAFAFGEPWREAGHLARALAPYIGMHFIASPLAVVTIAWRAQAWALRFSIVGQVLFVSAMVLGVRHGGLTQGAWAVSAVMAIYFACYFRALATWKEVPDVRAA